MLLEKLIEEELKIIGGKSIEISLIKENNEYKLIYKEKH